LLVLALAFTLVLGGFYLVSLALWSRIEHRHPPEGAFVEAGDTRFHVLEHGSSGAGLPIILVHGASGNASEMLVSLGPALAGRRIISFDRPGHGYSSRPSTPDIRFPTGQAARLVELMDRLGVERAVIVGHSWGAALALSLAILAPERVAGLVLAAPASHAWFAGGIRRYSWLTALPLVGPAFSRLFVLPVGSAIFEPALAAVFAPDPVPPGYLEAGKLALCLRPPHFRANALDLVGLDRFLAWQSTQYPAVRAPTVILTGDRDRVVSPLIHAHALARQIPGAELRLLRGRGHMVSQVEPGAVVQAIDEVIARSGERLSSAPE